MKTIETSHMKRRTAYLKVLQPKRISLGLHLVDEQNQTPEPSSQEPVVDQPNVGAGHADKENISPDVISPSQEPIKMHSFKRRSKHLGAQAKRSSFVEPDVVNDDQDQDSIQFDVIESSQSIPIVLFEKRRSVRTVLAPEDVAARHNDENSIGLVRSTIDGQKSRNVVAPTREHAGDDSQYKPTEQTKKRKQPTRRRI